MGDEVLYGEDLKYPENVISLTNSVISNIQ